MNFDIRSANPELGAYTVFPSSAAAAALKNACTLNCSLFQANDCVRVCSQLA
jgi:hypothetical protein